MYVCVCMHACMYICMYSEGVYIYIYTYLFIFVFVVIFIFMHACREGGREGHVYVLYTPTCVYPNV